MDLEEFLDLETDVEAERRRLAAERSYQIIDHLNLDERVAPVRDATSVGRASPGIFIGRSNYPNISTGILSPVDPDADPSAHVSSGDWYDRGLDIEHILRYRTGLLNSSRRADVKVADEWDGFLGTQREVAIADHPVGVEVSLARSPEVSVGLDDVATPTGPRAPATDAILTENPHVPRQVEKTISDDDWRAEGAMTYLYRRGFDVYEIRNILSAGALGEAANRRLVPTRWSITAVDDTIGQYLRGRIRNATAIDQVEVHHSAYIGNRYWVIMVPGRWEFELVEMKRPESVWNAAASGTHVGSDHEGYDGRTAYVEETAGAYYASRLAVLEHLVDRGRQAKVLVLRDVTGAYWAPVGVWQIRESVRDAFHGEHATAPSLHAAVTRLLDHLPVSAARLRRASTLVEGLQSSLDTFARSEYQS